MEWKTINSKGVNLTITSVAPDVTNKTWTVTLDSKVWGQFIKNIGFVRRLKRHRIIPVMEAISKGYGAKFKKEPRKKSKHEREQNRNR